MLLCSGGESRKQDLGPAADVVVRLMLEEKTKAATLYVYEAINIGVSASVAIAVDETMEE